MTSKWPSMTRGRNGLIVYEQLVRGNINQNTPHVNPFIPRLQPLPIGTSIYYEPQSKRVVRDYSQKACVKWFGGAKNCSYIQVKYGKDARMVRWITVIACYKHALVVQNTTVGRHTSVPQPYRLPYYKLLQYYLFIIYVVPCVGVVSTQYVTIPTVVLTG